MGQKETKLAKMTAEEQREFVNNVYKQNHEMNQKLEKLNQDIINFNESGVDKLADPFIEASKNYQEKCLNKPKMVLWLSSTANEECKCATEEWYRSILNTTKKVIISQEVQDTKKTLDSFNDFQKRIINSNL